MKDPYRYFRVEARELVDSLSRGLLELEREGHAAPEALQSLFRYAHTLKGASRAVKRPDIAERAHALEDGLAGLRQTPDDISPAQIEPLIAELQQIDIQVRSLDAPEPGHEEAATTPTSRTGTRSRPDMVRVEPADLDRLMRELGELRVRIEGLREDERQWEELERSFRVLTRTLNVRGGSGPDGGPGAGRELQDRLDDVRRTLKAVTASGRARGDAILLQLERLSATGLSLRLVRIEELFGALERAARETAGATGKQVTFKVEGGEHRIDAASLSRLRDGLLHVVRNSVVHGLESPEERVAHGKPAVGRVRFIAERRGPLIALICEDDGRGLDTAALSAAAVREGGVSAEGLAQMTETQRRRLALLPGVSTAGTLTEEAGRGVGLDVLRAAVAELRGDITIDSTPGQGTRFTVVIPSSLHALRALLCEAGGEVAALPLDAVMRVYSLHGHDPEEPGLVHDGQVVPLVPLRSMVGDAASDAALRTAIIVEADGARAAVGVERLLGSAQLVMRPLPSTGGPLPLVGAAFDATGAPRPVVDPLALVRSATQGSARTNRGSSPSRRQVLVVDDSLTTRMLEQSILESAGYDVDLASSAEEALEKVSARSYALVLCDVEMPGMSGIEFVARTREDARTRDIPAVIVSSRGAPEDIRRGMEAGARAYVVKGEFDQRKFLETVRRLID